MINHTLRAATPDDLDFQRKLYAATRAEEMNAAQFTPEMRASFITMQFNAQTTHYSNTHPGAEWSIIECGGACVGRIIVDRTDKALNLMDIALMPEFRGRGIGTELLNTLCAEATAKQLPLRLFAYTGERAIGLYHRLGFKDVHEDGIYTELVWKPEGMTK
jgi:ribosomal protein S18 acetylase RimI-like enzyme